MKRNERLVVEFLSNNALLNTIIELREYRELNEAFRSCDIPGGTIGAKERMVNLASIIEVRDRRLVFVSGVKARCQGEFVVLKDCRGEIVGRFPKHEIERVYYEKIVFENPSAGSG